DNIFYGQGFPNLLREAVKNAEADNKATVFGYYVNDPERYGVAEFDKEGNVLGIEEKPLQPKSNYAVIGLYFYPNRVVEVAKNIRPSARGELEITTVNQEFLKEKQLKVQLLGRGFAWLDTGTFGSLSEASTFIEVLEKRQGLKISCLEEIAWRNGWIDDERLRNLAEPMKKNEYGVSSGIRRLLIKCLLMTKMTILLVLIFSTQTFAHSYGQGINLNLERVQIKRVLKSIEDQGNFRFVYKDQLLKGNQLVSIEVRNASLDEVLGKIFRNTNLTYRRLSSQLVVIVGDKVTESQLAAAAIRITGRVINDKGEPLTGVSVVEKGTNNGTTTASDGTFSIEVSSPASVLTFSYVGFKNREIAVNSPSALANVVLTPDVSSLNDIVVIGYGTAKKSDLTGAVAVVKADKLMDMPVPNITQALQGKVAGVDVSVNSNAPGAGAKVRVRGLGSINSSLDPLYVVDGVAGVDGNSINPNDIASIEVLKDASSTAIYGARGANGVIMITTKRGRSGTATVTYEGNVNVAQLYRHLPALNSDEFVQVYNTAFANGQKFDPNGAVWAPPKALNHINYPLLFDANDKPIYNTNWEKEVYKPALSHSHQLNFQGGNDKTVYSVSLGYLNQDGIMTTSNFNRYSARFTLDTDIKTWLKLGGSISVIKSQQRMVSDGNGGLNVPRMVTEEVPLLPIKYPDGTWAGNSDIDGLEGGANPVHIAENRYTLNNNFQTLGNTYLLFKLAKGLEFKSDFGYNLNDQKNNFQH
ncbi:MAG: SusC/RagA family TonB-linked outer membrane protein, partial [Sphingobacteriales bacterium]|nr:SusC/RagA family TonB-linked outer membrane protein [Sphingobacteriales bacterium]